jgi:hypothetical protein
VQYVRGSFWAAHTFTDLIEAQAAASLWCERVAGQRIHGTTAARPTEAFAQRGAGLLLPVPPAYDQPILRSVKVHRDHHVEIAKALYSVPTDWIGAQLDARADSELVKLFHHGRLIKTHPRQPPGGRSTDPGDLPTERVGYAMRDLDRLRATAERHGHHIGIYVHRLLDDPLPWTRMRAVYRLLGLVRRYGPAPVEDACRTAPGPRRHLRRQDRRDARPRPGEHPHPTTGHHHGRRALRPRPLRVRRPTHPVPSASGRRTRPHQPGAQPMTQPLTSSTSQVDPLGADLLALLRTLKLSGIKDTLPERLALAKTRGLSHHQFLEQILTDEVARRDHRSAATRAIRAGLIPQMRIETWTEPGDLVYDRAAFADLTALRFLDAGHNLLILGPPARPPHGELRERPALGIKKKTSYAQSIVAGGFDVMSTATRLTPSTSLTRRCDSLSSTSREK